MSAQPQDDIDFNPHSIDRVPETDDGNNDAHDSLSPEPRPMECNPLAAASNPDVVQIALHLTPELTAHRQAGLKVKGQLRDLISFSVSSRSFEDPYAGQEVVQRAGVLVGVGKATGALTTCRGYIEVPEDEGKTLLSGGRFQGFDTAFSDRVCIIAVSCMCYGVLHYLSGEDKDNGEEEKGQLTFAFKEIVYSITDVFRGKKPLIGQVHFVLS